MLLSLLGVMIAWTGIENFRLGRFDPPPPAIEPDGCQVSMFPSCTIGLRTLLINLVTSPVYNKLANE